jgi:uncharacterized membrane protein YccC
VSGTFVSTARATLRSALRRSPEPPAIEHGIRAAIVTALPIVAGDLWSIPALSWVALGGFQASLIDSGGPLRRRALAIGSVAFLGAVSCGVGTVAGVSPPIALPAVFVWALLSSASRAYPADLAAVGTTGLVAFLIGLGRPGSVSDAIEHAALYLAGGAAALLVALVWPQAADRPLSRDAAPRDDRDHPRRATPFALLRPHLRASSPLFRHAIRLAIAATAAQALVFALHITRGYWLTLTVVIILQPVASATFERAAARVVGTVLGGIVAATINAIAHRPIAAAAFIVPLTVLTVAVRPLSYTYFTLFLTPLFVLVAESSSGDWHLAELRILNTLLGGALALLSAAILWPQPESAA